MFNVYGERQSLENPYQGVVSIFIANILNGEPITIHSDGEQSRDFVYIQDVVDADGYCLIMKWPMERCLIWERVNFVRSTELVDVTLAAFDHSRASLSGTVRATCGQGISGI